MNIRDGGPIAKVINEAIRKQERDAKARKQNEKRLRTKKTAESGERLDPSSGSFRMYKK